MQNSIITICDKGLSTGFLCRYLIRHLVTNRINNAAIMTNNSIVHTFINFFFLNGMSDLSGANIIQSTSINKKNRTDMAK